MFNKLNKIKQYIYNINIVKEKLTVQSIYKDIKIGQESQSYPNTYFQFPEEYKPYMPFNYNGWLAFITLLSFTLYG